MGEISDQIEQEIREKRNQLGENFTELEQKIKHAVDWRVQFAECPVTLIALASVAALCFGIAARSAFQASLAGFMQR